MRRLAALFTVLCALVSVAFAEETGDIAERYALTSGENEIAFAVGTNGVYEAAIFGTEGASYVLSDGEGVVIQGQSDENGILFSERLTSETTYTLSVENSDGSGTLEIMRSALGRSYFDPLTLTDGYVKAIVAENDVHWYSFTAQYGGLHTIRVESDMDTVGVLLDEKGNTLCENDNCDDQYEPDFLMRVNLTKGETYYLRLWAKAGETGPYTLRLITPESGTVAVESVSLSESDLTMNAGEQRRVRAVLSPETAQQDVVWFSTNPAVATVDADGGITAVSSGTAEIVAQAYDCCEKVNVTVSYVPVTEIQLLSDMEISIPAGSTSQIACTALPENASVQRMVFGSSDENIATVDEEGTVTGMAEGVAQITITSGKGEAQATVKVFVTKALPVYRVLAVGIQQYDDGRERIGATNTTQGIADMFSNFTYETGSPEVTMRVDTTRKQLVRAIKNTFAESKNTDISILYINCHGGNAYLEMRDGEKITCMQLYRILQGIQGRIVLILDCCQSGAFLSEGTPFRSSKYTVLTSASETQDSYRMSYDGAENDAAMTTVFARSFTEGGGWSIVKDRTQSLAADTNRDRIVYGTDAACFTTRRVKSYLAASSVTQDVQLFPKNVRWLLFRKES